RRIWRGIGTLGFVLTAILGGGCGRGDVDAAADGRAPGDRPSGAADAPAPRPCDGPCDSCGDRACDGAATGSSGGADCGPCSLDSFCGDGRCDGEETCSYCAADCGVCGPNNVGDGDVRVAATTSLLPDGLGTFEQYFGLENPWNSTMTRLLY